MSTRMLEVDVYPEDLLTREHNNQSDAEVQWWAVYTRSRQEKELARRLLEMEISFYCPIVPRSSKSPAGRIRTADIPLFSNYVFMFCDGADRYRALQTNTISQTLQVPDGPGLAHDLRQIQKLIQLGSPISLQPRLQPGKRVRITAGALKGLEGVLLKHHDEEHLFVAVNFLQQGASVKLADYQIESVE